MPKWSYTNQWENPQKTLDAIRKKRGKMNSSPVFFGYWAEAAPYRVALADHEENLHSLIQENTCTCGLRIEKSENVLAIIESKHHRNHKTLEPEPNPKFRGLVGRRITWPLMGTDAKHHVDVKWDLIVQSSRKSQ